MKYALFLPLMLYCGFVFCQEDNQEFAVINDTDGYTNVRSGPGSQHEVIGRVLEGEVFLVIDATSEAAWQLVEFYVPKGTLKEGQKAKFSTERLALLTGYMHRSRIQLLNEFSKLPDKALVVEVRDFAPNRHRVIFKNPDATPGERKIVMNIDGYQLPWGIDALYLPWKEYISLQAFYQGITYSVPPVVLRQYANPNPRTHEALADEKGNVYISAGNSDGAGTYTVIFSISPQGIRHHSGWFLY